MQSKAYPNRPLEDLLSIHDSQRIPVRKADRRPGPYPYYGASGVTDWVDAFLFDGTYLLLAEDGENLRTKSLPIAFLATGKFWVNNHAHILQGNDELDTKFFAYALRVSDIDSYISGSTRPKLTQRDMRKIPLPAPSLQDRQRIAHVLSSFDEKIELNHLINQTLEQIAHAIFKSWFIDFDPVVYNAVQVGNPVPKRFEATAARYRENADIKPLPTEILKLFPESFEDSEIGPIPAGWEVKPLDKVATFLNGLACQKYPVVEGGMSLPVIKIREMRQGISERTDRADAGVPRKYIVHDGDVLFSWSGSLVIDTWTEGKAVLNQHVFKVTSDEYEKWFFYYWTNYHLAEFQRIAADKATTMGHIKRHHLAEAKALVASKEVMDAAGSVIGPLFEKQVQGKLESATLAKLRDTLLPMLISGELLIPHAEALAAEATG